MDELMSSIINVVIIPLLPLLQILMATLIGFAIYKLKQRTKNEQVNQYLDILQDLVTNVVGTINQTAVEALKQSQGGKLTDKQKELYFSKAKDKVIRQLTDTQKKILGEVYNDLDGYINDLIENTVGSMKGGKGE